MFRLCFAYYIYLVAVPVVLEPPALVPFLVVVVVVVVAVAMVVPPVSPSPRVVVVAVVHPSSPSSSSEEVVVILGVGGGGRGRGPATDFVKDTHNLRIRKNKKHFKKLKSIVLS